MIRNLPAASLLAGLLVLASSVAAQEPSSNSNDALLDLSHMQAITHPDAAPGTPQVENLVTTSWALEGNAAGVHYGSSCTTVGDVNADGYSDVMVTVDGTVSGTGQCHLYLGGAGGLSTSPVWSRTNFTRGPHASPAGDVNGDGYADFIVGYGDLGGVGAGAVYVYYGSGSGIPSGPFTRTQAGGSFGYSFNTAGDVNGDGYDDVVVGAPRWSCQGTENGIFEIWYGGAGGLSTLNIVAHCGQLTDYAHFGFSVGTAGDINADGYDDVIVGAPDYAVTIGPSAPRHGYVGVYLGGAGGLGTMFTVPAIRMYSSQAGCKWGAQVATAGDFNGDGYCDVMASAPLYSIGGGPEVGDVVIFSGGPSPSGTLSSLWAGYELQSYCHFGQTLAPAGDVNGDGYADIAVGAPDYDNGPADNGYVYVLFGRNGPPTTAQNLYGTQASEHFSTALGTAGDVDGDGFSDLIVGAPYWSNPDFAEGRAVLYRGTADRPQLTPMWSVQGAQHFENVGWSVSAAGDVNADGYGDAIVGAWNYDGPSYRIGRVLLYLGTPNGGLAPAPVPQIDGDEPFAAFGFNVARAGDVNGDGFEDVIVGQPYGYPPRAKIFPGGPSGITATPIWTGTGADNSSYGVVVSTAGDVNGDGYSDVLVGAPTDDTYGTDSGRAYLYLGGLGGPSPSPSRTFHGTQDGEQFGSSLSGAGDVNGDGYSDIVISAPLWDGNGPGEVDAGRVTVYHGNSTNVSTLPYGYWGGGGNRLGTRVAGLGDVNGDGYADVAVTAPLFSFFYTHNGVAIIHPGGPGGINTAGSIGTVFGTENEGQLGWTLAAAGDVNGDGKADMLVGSYVIGASDNGSVLLYTDYASNNPFWQKFGDFAGDWFGFSCAGAGDVNGDGFGDLLVGAAAMESPGYQDAGRALLYLGNLTDGDDGLDRVVRIRSADDTREIAPLGKSPTNQVRVGTLGRSAAGPSKLTAQFYLEPKNGGATTLATYGPSPTSLASNGSTVALHGPTPMLLAGKNYAMKARVKSRSPFFPTTPWLTKVLDGRATMDFRTPAATLDAPQLALGTLELAAPRPNPSRGETALEFSLATAGHARLVIHDVAGREVARVADGTFAAGAHRRTWSGLDERGHEAPAGIYFLKLTTAAGDRVQRIVRMK